MQFECRVVGHEMVTKKDERLIKVKLRAASALQDVKVELLVSENERKDYPFGSTAYLDFSVQQTLHLEEGGRKSK